VVLCDLEGISQNEAADHLGWSRGTLKRRRERGRELLRSRLGCRGLALSTGLVAAMLTPDPELQTISERWSGRTGQRFFTQRKRYWKE
jgi:hypothetical protein